MQTARISCPITSFATSDCVGGAGVSPFWLVGSILMLTLGELCLSPIGLSMVTKLAPLRLASLMMGAWFGFVALANYAAGMIGSYVGESGAMSIFGGIAITAVASAAILLVFANKLIYWMHGAEGHVEEPQHTADDVVVTQH